MTTTEGNIIIAKYDGYKEVKLPELQVSESHQKLPAYIYYEKEGMTIKELTYHKDWNALIPVVRKARKELKIEINKDLYAIQGWPYEKEIRVIMSRLEKHIRFLQLEPLWNTLILAIHQIDLLRKEKCYQNG